MDRDTPGSPGCFPGLRPLVRREDRALAGFLVNGESEDGGLEEFDESASRRRFSSATSARNSFTSAVKDLISSACTTTSSASSSYVGLAINTLSCNSFRRSGRHADQPN